MAGLLNRQGDVKTTSRARPALELYLYFYCVISFRPCSTFFFLVGLNSSLLSTLLKLQGLSLIVHSRKVRIQKREKHTAMTANVKDKSSSGNEGVSPCCLSGKIQNVKQTGQVEEIGGLKNYVSAPENGSKEKSVIFLADNKSHSFT
jgi:hypothetical protein